LNLSKSGGSMSLGGRGATLNLSKRGKMVTTALPGSGLSYRSSREPWGAKHRSPVDYRMGIAAIIALGVVAGVILAAQ
jgi:Protein of unknown function (DUF4236)